MENVMLNSIQTQIKIVDFGLSNIWNTNCPLRTHCGSPEYAAPELFMTGRLYGAEVDLWSLGIILYGMVLGQLPFVSAKNEHVTSQERRRRLVAQINKGLATSHRKALAIFSSDFRSLINKLLVAESSKRMTVKELLIHPWISDKGKKLIRSNPIKSIEANFQSKMISHIADLLRVDSTTVISAMEQEPLGKVDGMYRILAHKHQLAQLQGDGVTRTFPSLTLLEISDYSKARVKEKNFIKLSTDRSATKKKPMTATNCRRSDFCTPRIVSTSKSVKEDAIKISDLTKKDGDHVIQRPCSVQASVNQAHNQSIDYRAIKSPTLRRKAYSANITPKTNRPFSPNKDVRKLIKSGAAKEMELKAESRHCTKIDYLEISNCTRKSPMCLRSKPAISHQNKDSQRPRMSITEKSRCKSDHVANRKRPVTGPLNPITERPIKHEGELTITYSSSDKPKTASEAVRSVKQNIFDRQESWEKNPFAFGDNSLRASTATYKQLRKPPTIYDPIAKSIADYVVNNVPDKLHKFPWFKK